MASERVAPPGGSPMKSLDPAGPALLDRRRRLLKVTTEREIDATAEAIWAVISDHTTWTSWHEGYDEHVALTEQTSGLGAQFQTKEWVLLSESEIVRWEPTVAVGVTTLRARGLRWLLKSYYSELVIEPVGGTDRSCRVHYRAAFTGTWAFWLLSAYSVGQSLGIIYFDARSSLKKLDRYVRQRSDPT